MPELPEVEVLVRHLAPWLKNKTIRGVRIFRSRVIAPTTAPQLSKALKDAKITGVSRRGKYLLFNLEIRAGKRSFVLLGHLGMTGRIYPAAKDAPLPKHAAVVLDLGKHDLIYEDTRYFGRLTLDASPLERLGPEPLGREFTAESLASALKRSTQPIKVKLLDQSLVAGVGNIYASEALFRAGISPRAKARNLQEQQVNRLWQAIREVLGKAIEMGSTVPLDFGGTGVRDGLFYHGSAAKTAGYYEERLLVYDRRGKPCFQCGKPIKRLVQGARSTFYCPHCQAG
jgi:formamidopyrimidine-DNA glycosylase